jgi:crotonobetainyl-CoA:carnitine CoA-transferase CaiB-like acyl-CoA transferase
MPGPESVDPNASGPLAGIRVVDLSAVVSGPFAAMWLADQGAEVIKVEDTALGDITRGNGRASTGPGLSGLYVNCNRGKRALAIDMHTDQGRQVVLDLCRDADVVIQNWRPGVADRLGVGWSHVSAINPRVIYVSISGYGESGPYANRRVYDPIIQGLSGHVAVQVNPEIPIPDLVRTIVCDKATALSVAQSVSAALFARERGTASGQHLQIAMLDAALSFFFPDGFMSKGLLDDPARDHRPTLAQVYRLQATADGHLTYFAASQQEFEGLFRALGHPEWIDDPRYADGEARVAHRGELGEDLDAAFRSVTNAELIPRLDHFEVPFGEVRELDELYDDPQIRHNEALQIRTHPAIGRVQEARHPVKFSSTPVSERNLAPMQGEHTEVILRELGRSDADIDALRAAHVIR